MLGGDYITGVVTTTTTAIATAAVIAPVCAIRIAIRTPIPENGILRTHTTVL